MHVVPKLQVLVVVSIRVTITKSSWFFEYTRANKIHFQFFSNKMVRRNTL